MRFHPMGFLLTLFCVSVVIFTIVEVVQELVG
jgi:hypothetical protein